MQYITKLATSQKSQKHRSPSPKYNIMYPVDALVWTGQSFCTQNSVFNIKKEGLSLIISDLNSPLAIQYVLKINKDAQR